MEFLLTLLVLIVILGLVWWVVNALAGAFGLPAPIVVLVQVVIVIVAVVYLLSMLRGGSLHL